MISFVFTFFIMQDNDCSFTKHNIYIYTLCLDIYIYIHCVWIPKHNGQTTSFNCLFVDQEVWTTFINKTFIDVLLKFLPMLTFTKDITS